MEEMSGEHVKVITQINNLTENLSKLNYDLIEKQNELTAVKGCMKKLEKSGLNKSELAESRKLFKRQLELIELAIQTNKVYTDAMNSKIDELKMVYDDLSADIEAIIEFISRAKFEPILPLVEANEAT